MTSYRLVHPSVGRTAAPVLDSFQRSVVLPPTMDADRVKATYKNGVLEIQLPKKEEARPKAIKVEAA